MRIAFLTALAEASGGEGDATAFRRFAGRSVLSHQIDCAASLECEAVVCLVSGTGPEVIAAQHRAEAAGLRFRAIESLRALSGVIDAQDTVVVIADGLRLDPAHGTDALGSRSTVPTFPAEIAVARGFERIDAQRAWSGIMAIRGDLIERLSGLPCDADAQSALLRIALQAGVRTVPLDPLWLDEGEWAIRDDATSLRQGEVRWIANRFRPAPFSAPGLAVAERIGIRLAPDIVGTRLQHVPFYVGVGAGIFSALAGATNRPLTALLLVATMYAALSVAGVVSRLYETPGGRTSPVAGGVVLDWANDALLVGLLALADRATGSWIDLFLPLMLVALLRPTRLIGPDRFAPLAGDRITLLALLIPATFFGSLQPVMALVSVLALIVLFDGARRDKLTTL